MAEGSLSIDGFEIQITRIDEQLDLASTSRHEESHWMLLDNHCKVRDMLSVVRSYDGKSVEQIETPTEVSLALKVAIEMQRAGGD